MSSSTSSLVMTWAKLAAGADRKAPPWARAAAVRSTMSSSAARRAKRTAFAIPSTLDFPWATTTGRRTPSRIAPPVVLGSSCSRRPARRPRTSSPPSDDRSPPRMASRTAPATVFAVPSISFRATLPVKPSVTTTSDRAGRQVGALDVAREVERARRELLVRGHDLVRSLLRLLADREQPDARAGDSVHRLHEGRAHVSELDEVLGPDVHVRARV